MQSRWYTITDDAGGTRRIPRVTTVLDVTMPLHRREKLVRALMDDPISATLRRESGAARGSALDAWFKNCCIEQRVLPFPSDLRKLCRQLAPYLRTLVKVPRRYPSQRVWHPSGFAGTLDLVADRVGRGLTIYELKTSAYRPWPEAVAEAQLQATAYYLGWNYLNPDRLADGICTLHVTPYELLETYFPDSDPRFLELLSQWRFRLRQFGSRFTDSQADFYV